MSDLPEPSVIGIDPGLNGAIVQLCGGWLQVISVPTVKARGRGREVDWSVLAFNFDAQGFGSACHAFIERVGARPGQGTSSMFKFGYVSGGLRGLVSAYAIPTTLVTPQEWKRTMRLGSGKDAARQRAAELFPKQAGLFARVKDADVAEAALIAQYGYDYIFTGREE